MFAGSVTLEKAAVLNVLSGYRLMLQTAKAYIHPRFASEGSQPGSVSIQGTDDRRVVVQSVQFDFVSTLSATATVDVQTMSHALQILDIPDASCKIRVIDEVPSLQAVATMPRRKMLKIIHGLVSGRLSYVRTAIYHEVLETPRTTHRLLSSWVLDNTSPRPRQRLARQLSRRVVREDVVGLRFLT